MKVDDRDTGRPAAAPTFCSLRNHQPACYQVSIMNPRSMSKWITIIGVAAAMFFWAAVAGRSVWEGSTFDFIQIYTGASAIWEGTPQRLYDLAWHLQRQEGLMHRKLPMVWPYMRPAFFAALFSPLGALSLQAAFAVWLVLQFAVLFACWAWAARRRSPDVLLLCALFLPSILGILQGQDCALVLGLLVAGYSLAERGEDRLAGVCFALTLFKFHLVLLVPVALLLHRRWRAIISYCATAAVLAAVSMLVASPRQYLEVLMADRMLAQPPQYMINVYAIAANLGLAATGWRLALGLGAAALAVRAAWNTSFRACLSAAVVASLVLTPHVYMYDSTLLFLPIVLSLEFGPAALHRVALLLFTPLPYLASLGDPPWSIIPPVIILLFMAALAWKPERPLPGKTGNVPADAAALPKT